MALPQYSVEELIENIKRRCSVPTSQLTFTPEDFALLANDEMQGEVVPLIMATREEYFVDYYDVASPADGVIPFPENTVGSKVRSICYVQQGSPLVLTSLPRIDLDVVAGVGFSNFNTLAGFYIQGNDIVLYPNSSVPPNTTIRIYFYKRTLVLTEPSTYGQITAIDPDNNILQLNFVPSGWEIGDKLNTISSKPGFDVTNGDLTIANISAPSVVVNSVEGIEVGDYISRLGYSAVPQIPIEAHPYLAQLTAAKCLESLGDRTGMDAALSKAAALKQALLVMISQRVDGSVKKVMNPNGGLRLGAGLGRWGRGSTGGGTW
jgi:hypothetical protein